MFSDMTARHFEFGYHPGSLLLRAGPVAVEPLPNLAETVSNVETGEGIEKDWIYAPPQQVRDFGTDSIRTLPYPSRVFGLPKTHAIEHASADSVDHMTFHLWVLSFFTGMRLTSTEAGFVDATPIKPGKLVDFVLFGNSLVKSVELAEAFWLANRTDPQRAQLFGAAVHALFLGQNPIYLQFERFIFLYTAFDACFALANSMRPPATRVSHAQRVAWMCSLFGMVTPPWADPVSSSGSAVATLRNATVHEALFVGQPLGFAVHGVGTNENLTLEMKALICRLLVALLGGVHADYVRSPIDTRQRHGLDLI